MTSLFDPLKIGKLEIRNRFLRSATYYALSDVNGFIDQPSVDLMKSLAEGEVGLIMTGYAYVLKNGQSFPDMNGIQDDDHIPGFQKMTRAVHKAGGKIAMQIAHCGSGSTYVARTGGDYVAVSLIDGLPDFGKPAREMNKDDIGRIIEAFGLAAARVQEAGFDGVQIHGAHGYLVSQFLSPLTNRREDQWGGSLENRMSFVVEVVRAIKARVDSDFPVMIKLGVRDFPDEEPGFTVEEGARVCQALQKEGVALIEISHGLMGRKNRKNSLGITSPEREAPYLPEARVIREAVDLPLALVMGLRSLPVMEKVIESGACELISMSRPFIREPDLVRRWRQGDARPADCISCGGCFNTDDKGRMSVYCRQLRKKTE